MGVDLQPCGLMSPSNARSVFFFFWSVISAEVRFLAYLKALREGCGMQKVLQT